MTPARTRTRRVDDRGAGLLASMFGVTLFLLFALVATQLAVHLLAATAVSAEADDTARRLARASVQRAAPDVRAATETAELERLRARMARIDPTPEVTLVDHPDRVVVRVRVDSPGGVVTGLRSTLGLAGIERVASARREVP